MIFNFNSIKQKFDRIHDRLTPNSTVIVPINTQPLKEFYDIFALNMPDYTYYTTIQVIDQ